MLSNTSTTSDPKPNPDRAAMGCHLSLLPHDISPSCPIITARNVISVPLIDLYRHKHGDQLLVLVDGAVRRYSVPSGAEPGSLVVVGAPSWVRAPAAAESFGGGEGGGGGGRGRDSRGGLVRRDDGENGFVPRPRGRAPVMCEWNSSKGVWVQQDGKEIAPKPSAPLAKRFRDHDDDSSSSDHSGDGGGRRRRRRRKVNYKVNVHGLGFRV